MISVIIPAGGSSVRFGGGTKKQFLELSHELMINRTISVFLNHPDVAEIVVCLPQEDLKHPGLIRHDKISYVVGGKTRSESVFNGFFALKNQDEVHTVLIHDAARPLVTRELISKVATAVRQMGGAIPALPLSDTIKEVDLQNRVQKTLNRKSLRAVQTPQGFKYALLKNASENPNYKNALYTDECMLLEEMGIEIIVVEGERQNIKITDPFDLVLAERILTFREEKHGS